MIQLPPRHGLFVLLRRMRAPLMVLICSYALAVLGMTLMPGQTPDGQPWKMSFFHAFYFVSFLGNTIGLGEIPYPFSDAQRLWATFSIYLTVLAWLYSVGSLLTILQDPLLRRLWREQRFEYQVQRLREPFYLLCGYDQAGRRVTRELTEDGLRVVVLDADPQQVATTDVDDHLSPVPALAGDATDPRVLRQAGVTHPHCRGLLVLTGSDAANARITLAARLLNPGLMVLCAARDHAWHPRIAAAGARALINPYDRFAARMGVALRSPSLHVLYEALTAQRQTAMAPVTELPRGRWVVCGWGRFAKALKRRLLEEGLEVHVVDADFHGDPHCSGERANPTDPGVLRRAGLEDAVALVAGLGDDIDNLAVLQAARQLRPGLFTVARLSQRRNASLFRAAAVDLVMGTGYMVATEVLRHTRAPLLHGFLNRAEIEDEAWAAALLARVRQVVGDEVLESWSLRLEPDSLPQACARLAEGQALHLDQLLTRADGSPLGVVPLLLERNGRLELLPTGRELLWPGDHLLLCGSAAERARLRAQALAWR
ncbi:TrkA family potassium uptake protein [Inhella sp.]|uniref:potassium channel family protein n=1 Tax=Inhella sp. TaxID=1921806 RepID=UPI0035B24FFB